MKIIIGLQNKGSEYQKTRHNIGEHVVRAFAGLNAGVFSYDKYTLSNTCKTPDGKVLLVVPELYMNESGRVIDGLFKTKREDGEYADLLVVRDDIDMGLGNMKLVFDGGSGGHNGDLSIKEHLKSKKYWQLKIGVAPVDAEDHVIKPAKEDVSDFVVGKFRKDEWDLMEEMTKKAIGAIVDFIK